MSILSKYISVIEEYHKQGLLEGEAEISLLVTQERLLSTMLLKLPEDAHATILLCNNYLAQNSYNKTLELANGYRVAHPTNFKFWEMCFDILTYFEDSQHSKELSSLVEQSKLVSIGWNVIEQTKWKSKCEEVMQ